jgi:hypothetical protein
MISFNDFQLDTQSGFINASSLGQAWGRWVVVLIALFATFSQAHAQPIPPAIAAEHANYIFAVYTPTSPAEAMIWRTADAALTTHRLINKSDSTEIRLAPVRHTALRTFVDLGESAGAVETLEEQSSPTLHELLCYDQLLSPAQRQLTESYLAIKHGLTLDQRLPTNYLAQRPDGSTYPVWTATDEPAFRHRITGLAYDTSANLSRLTGASVLAPDLLSLSWQDAPDRTAYLLLADDNAPTARSLASGSPTLQPLQRRWRVETNGQVPETTLNVNPRQLFDRVLPGETLVLLQIGGTSTLIPPNSVSTSGISTLIPPSQASANNIAFTSLSFPPDTVSYLQLALRCDDPALGCSTNTEPPEDDFFTSVQLSPNPAAAGTPQQLRVALAEASGLVVTVYDALGRQVSTQVLTATTHHLAEIILPAPGTYSLHLRSRLLRRSAPSFTLQVIAY